AKLAALLTEPGLGGTAVDIEERFRGLARDRSPRGRDAMKLAERWARLAGNGTGGEADHGLLLCEAFPERIARAKGKTGEYLLASGRGAMVDAAESLSQETWLAVAELGGGDVRDRVRLAARLDARTLETDLAHRIETEDR